MFNKVPEVSHLRTFGAVAYCYVPKQFRDPFRHKQTADVGIFVGYDRQSTGYLVYFPQKKRVAVRRDVWFDEQWRFAVLNAHGLPQSNYVHPALTSSGNDSPFPPKSLVSGGVVRVHASAPLAGLDTLVDNVPLHAAAPGILGGGRRLEAPKACAPAVAGAPPVSASTAGGASPAHHVQF